MRIEELNLNMRTMCVLKLAGMTDTEGLRILSDEELLKIPYMNRACVKELRNGMYCTDCRKSIYHECTCEENELNLGAYDPMEHGGCSCDRKEPVD